MNDPFVTVRWETPARRILGVNIGRPTQEWAHLEVADRNPEFVDTFADEVTGIGAICAYDGTCVVFRGEDEVARGTWEEGKK